MQQLNLTILKATDAIPLCFSATDSMQAEAQPIEIFCKHSICSIFTFHPVHFGRPPSAVSIMTHHHILPKIYPSGSHSLKPERHQGPTAPKNCLKPLQKPSLQQQKHNRQWEKTTLPRCKYVSSADRELLMSDMFRPQSLLLPLSYCSFFTRIAFLIQRRGH